MIRNQAGRDTRAGFVKTAVFRGSTVQHPTAKQRSAHGREFTDGRRSGIDSRLDLTNRSASGLPLPSGG